QMFYQRASQLQSPISTGKLPAAVRIILSGAWAVIELAKPPTFHEEEHCHEHHATLEVQLGADAPAQLLAARLSTRSRRSWLPTRAFSERTGSSLLRMTSCVRSSERLATLSIG